MIIIVVVAAVGGDGLVLSSPLSGFLCVGMQSELARMRQLRLLKMIDGVDYG